jgi:hypothetical protein
MHRKPVTHPGRGLAVYQNIWRTGDDWRGGIAVVIHARITQQNYGFAHSVNSFFRD